MTLAEKLKEITDKEILKNNQRIADKFNNFVDYIRHRAEEDASNGAYWSLINFEEFDKQLRNLDLPTSVENKLKELGFYVKTGSTSYGKYVFISWNVASNYELQTDSI